MRIMLIVVLWVAIVGFLAGCGVEATGSNSSLQNKKLTGYHELYMKLDSKAKEL